MKNPFQNFTFKTTDKKIKNNRHLILEEIWEEIEKRSPKNSRKMFFIKTSKIPDHKLLEFRKWALSKEDFVRAFYGLCLKENKKIDGCA